MNSDTADLSNAGLEACFTDLAAKAGEAIMRHYGAGEPKTQWKDDGTPVTVADLEADAIISDGLAAAYPEIPVISEEAPEQHGRRHASFFIVDPLDGTSGFRRGGDDFTVNIALVRNGVPCAGVVFAPALDRMFVTMDIGRLKETSADGTRIHAALPAAAGGAPRVVASRSRSAQPELKRYLSAIKVSTYETFSSSFKFCLLAAGEADLYPRIGRTMEWDTAAGHAVLLAVGGTVLRINGLTPLTYGKRGYANPDFVAAVPGVKVPQRR